MEPHRSIPIVGYKGSVEFAEWLNGLADHVGVPVTVAIDLGLKALAEQQGYIKPMPRRVPAAGADRVNGAAENSAGIFRQGLTLAV